MSNLIIITSVFILFASFITKSLYTDASGRSFITAATTLNRMATFMEEKTNSIRSTIDSFALDSNITNILLQDNEERYKNVLVWNSNNTYISDIVSKNIYYSDIKEIKIVTENAIANSYRSSLFIQLPLTAKTKWYQHATNTTYSYFWNASSDFYPSDTASEDSIIFTRHIPFNNYTYNTFYVGYIEKEPFISLLSADETDPYSACILINTEGEMIAESSSFQTDNIIDWVIQSNKRSPYSIDLSLQKINGLTYYVGASHIPRTDLVLIYAYEHYKMRSHFFLDTIKNMCFNILIIFPIVFILSFIITLSITKRIDELKDHMLQASKGNFDIKILSSNEEDEISILNKHFNYMATKVSMLLDETYKNGQRIKELELISLQAQINPHFLYNTLDLIKWKAVKHHETEIEDLVSTLSSYYRIGLSQGDILVPLEAELSHVSSYVYIQNQRFDGTIQLVISVPERFMKYKIPKLTLQPIIENAIIHGILEKEVPSGTIEVGAFLEEYFVITILDDGVGIQADHISNNLNPEMTDFIVKTGYGLFNINERIKLVYGEEYGLEFSSKTGKGTKVSILLPPPINIQERGFYV